MARKVREKISNAQHNISNSKLSAGKICEAWRFHLKSLTTLKGLKYIPYTRHLLAAMIRPAKQAERD